jgi:hypothetical protein
MLGGGTDPQCGRTRRMQGDVLPRERDGDRTGTSVGSQPAEQDRVQRGVEQCRMHAEFGTRPLGGLRQRDLREYLAPAPPQSGQPLERRSVFIALIGQIRICAVDRHCRRSGRWPSHHGRVDRRCVRLRGDGRDRVPDPLLLVTALGPLGFVDA